MKPLTTWRLACANLAQRPLRSILLALIVAIFAFVLYAGSMVSANLSSGIASLSARMGADLLVVPQGAGKKMESVLLRAEPTTFLLEPGVLDVVRSIPTVAQASGQLFISSLDAQCCTVKVQLIGIDQESDFVVAPWLREALDRPLEGTEVIVGDYIFGEIGSELKFYDQAFRIVGRLAPTGMGFDSSVFMTMEAARKVAKIAMPDRKNDGDGAFSSILVRVAPGVDPVTISDEMLDRMGLRANINFVFASNMMSDTSAKLQTMVRLLMGAALAFWLAAAVVMFVVFFFAFNERQKEFATLRALGASKSKVVSVVMTEAAMLSAAGTVAGLLLGVLVIELFSVSIAQMIGLPYLAASGGRALALAAAAAVAGLVTSPLAMLPTAWRIGRRDIYTLLREAD